MPFRTSETQPNHVSFRIREDRTATSLPAAATPVPRTVTDDVSAPARSASILPEWASAPRCRFSHVRDHGEALPLRRRLDVRQYCEEVGHGDVERIELFGGQWRDGPDIVAGCFFLYAVAWFFGVGIVACVGLAVSALFALASSMATSLAPSGASTLLKMAPHHTRLTNPSKMRLIAITAVSFVKLHTSAWPTNRNPNHPPPSSPSS